MMSDEALPGLDDAFARRTSQADKRRTFDMRRGFDARDTFTPLAPSHPWWTFGETGPWIPAFFAIQFLWGAVLFVPGTQAIRPIVRALPYLTSLALLGVYFTRRTTLPRPAGSAWLVAALLLLVVNLLHPASQFAAGIAQCVFQLSIVAPAFWAYKAIRSPRQLELLFVLIFIMNVASAALGVAQVYMPGAFMPPQFNSLGVQLNDFYVESLSYLGRDGTWIVRPPGLTDQPGGAALAGALAAILGLGLLLRARAGRARLISLAAIAVGLAAIYLTQVRSVLMMVMGCVALLAAIAFRQGRRSGALIIAGGGAALVVAAFVWAASLGGDSVADRYLNIHEQGALQTYQEYRGSFLASTFNELLDTYPFGAGVGRWGMMNTYFGDPNAFRSAPIHAEIQLTGWLLDGGFPMWILYGTAIIASILAAFRLADGRDPRANDIVMIGVTLQIFIVGLAMAGPVFNTQLGILFWSIAGGLHGAVQRAADPSGESATESESDEREPYAEATA